MAEGATVTPIVESPAPEAKDPLRFCPKHAAAGDLSSEDAAAIHAGELRLVELSKPAIGIETPEPIELVRIAEPTGKSFRAMDRADGQVAKSIALLAACSNLIEPQIDRLRARDFSACMEAMAELGFTGAA